LYLPVFKSVVSLFSSFIVVLIKSELKSNVCCCIDGAELTDFGVFEFLFKTLFSLTLIDDCELLDFNLSGICFLIG